MEQARAEAQDHYPLVKDYNLLQLTEEYTLSNAQKAWLPQASGSLQGNWQSAVASYPDVLKNMLQQNGLDIRGMSHFSYKAAIDVSQMIWDGGRIKAQKDIARAQTRENILSDDVELYQVQARVDDLFFSILLLQQQGTAVDATIELLRANLERMQAMVDNGAAMVSDADAIKAELLSAQQQKLTIQSTREAYSEILGIYLGHPVTGQLSEPAPAAAPTSNSFDWRPESQLLTARKQTLQAQEEQIKAQTRPTLSAMAQGYFGYPGLNFMEAMMNRDPKFCATIGIALNWPINQLYTKKNSLRQLQAAQDRLDVAQEVFDFNSQVQATQQRREKDKLRQLSLTDEEILNLRIRVRQAAEARLTEGIIEPTDLLLKITDEKNARISANSRRIEYIQSTYNLSHTYNSSK
ncbi:MAG: TolC family protein [Bacteroidales bacterium]|nr:TolC family protein [Bacteroidales bacterium]